MRKKLFALLTVSALAVAALAGCGNSSSKGEDKTGNQTVEQQSSETVTIKDAKGEVQIPANPQRIVDLSGNSDILSVLGYSVVGTANSDAYDYTKFTSYLEDVLKGAKILGYSMQDTMDIEGILELDPDLIIISSVQEKMYDQLKEIAPTVMIQLAQTDWKEDVSSFADLMNKTETANTWLKEYEAKAKEVGESIRKTYGEDTTYLAMLASGGQLYVFDAAGIGSILYEDMGLEKPENMPTQENISLPVISYEGLADIYADYLFVVGTDSDFEALHQNSVYKNMRAVKDGHVVELPSSPYFNMGYSCIGREMFLDEVVSLMEKVNE